jgi:anti-sigma factor RsiW
MTCEEAQELITALVDGELLEREHDALESHLKDCLRCQLAAEQERLLKQTIRGRAERITAPIALRDRILSDQRILPKKSGVRWRDYVLPRLAIPAFVASVLLVIGLPTFFLLKPASEPVSAAALETYDLFAKGDVSTQPTESPDAIVERLSRATGGRFHPMGYDLSTIQLRPVAGFVREIQGRKTLVVIYQGLGGTLLCYTFLGSEQDAPANSAKFVDPVKKLNFYAFSRGSANAVLHREGDVICILASEMPMDKLLELAQSKAKQS